MSKNLITVGQWYQGLPIWKKIIFNILCWVAGDTCAAEWCGFHNGKNRLPETAVALEIEDARLVDERWIGECALRLFVHNVRQAGTERRGHMFSVRFQYTADARVPEYDYGSLQENGDLEESAEESIEKGRKALDRHWQRWVLALAMTHAPRI